MTAPKVLWSGKYAGKPAQVKLIGAKPIAYFVGRCSPYETDQLGIMEAAVLGLAKQNHTVSVLLSDAEQSLRAQAQSYRDEIRELRNRLAKLENVDDEVLAPLAQQLADEWAREEGRESAAMDEATATRQALAFASRRHSIERLQWQERLAKLQAERAIGSGREGRKK